MVNQAFRIKSLTGPRRRRRRRRRRKIPGIGRYPMGPTITYLKDDAVYRLHKLWDCAILDEKTRSKFGEHEKHGKTLTR